MGWWMWHLACRTSKIGFTNSKPNSHRPRAVQQHRRNQKTSSAFLRFLHEDKDDNALASGEANRTRSKAKSAEWQTLSAERKRKYEEQAVEGWADWKRRIKDWETNNPQSSASAKSKPQQVGPAGSGECGAAKQTIYKRALAEEQPFTNYQGL